MTMVVHGLLQETYPLENSVYRLIRPIWTRQWKVPQDEKLPLWINRVIKELEGQAETISTLAIEAERQRELDRQRRDALFKEWEREEGERRQAKALVDSHNELLKVIDDWAKTKNLERFFNEIEQAVEDLDGEEHKTAHV